MTAGSPAAGAAGAPAGAGIGTKAGSLGRGLARTPGGLVGR